MIEDDYYELRTEIYNILDSLDYAAYEDDGGVATVTVEWVRDKLDGLLAI